MRGASYGDLLCHVVVETPVKLTERQKDLLRQFDAEGADNSDTHNPRAKSFMDKLKDFFN